MPKHWLFTVAHTINHGLNIGLLFSLFKFCGWKKNRNIPKEPILKTLDAGKKDQSQFLETSLVRETDSNLKNILNQLENSGLKFRFLFV